MRPSYLGRILLQWCDSCHVPVLAPACSCGARTRPVPVTPPGDARPAFPADVSLVNRIYEEHFGAPLIPAGHLALLNKVPDPDRMEEVIAGGAVLGSIRFLAGEGRWEPIPRREAAAYLAPRRRYVVVDTGAVPSIVNGGASVLAPGLLEIEPSVKRGDEVFVLDEEKHCIAVGRAKVDAGEAAGMERGSIVRTRKNAPSTCIPGKASWEDAVNANAAVIGEKEAASVHFIREVAGRHPLPVNVSYSGGKDSLATLLLVRKALGAVPLLFADTGLELPETYANVQEVAGRYGLPLVEVSGEEAFWETFSREGPPAVNFRWCCRKAKLEPVKRAIGEHWGECLSFVGQRQYESFRRKAGRRVWRNPHVGNQVAAAPIQTWTALHVWLYLFRERAPYNILYEEGLDRVGCFMCPSSDRAVLERIRAMHPGLWETWDRQLRYWQRSHGLPDEWVVQEAWRMRGEAPFQ